MTVDIHMCFSYFCILYYIDIYVCIYRNIQIEREKERERWDCPSSNGKSCSLVGQLMFSKVELSWVDILFLSTHISRFEKYAYWYVMKSVRLPIITMCLSYENQRTREPEYQNTRVHQSIGLIKKWLSFHPLYYIYVHR